MEIKCSKCGKNLTDDKGTSRTGITVQVNISESFPKEEIEKLIGFYCITREGEYIFKDTDRYTWNFCHECLLDALFGRNKSETPYLMM